MRTKAFGVGQAKAGTATLWGLLGTNHRAAHEPEREETLSLILREAQGLVTATEVRDYLVDRDRRLDLDYDIAWANQFILGHLVDLWPHTKFVVLVREPYSWLQSIVGHILVRDVPGDVEDFLDFWFRPDEYPKSARDGDLPYSVDAFLSAWNAHVEVCRSTIPAGRRLMIRTEDLNDSHDQLAEFLDIDVASLGRDRVHLNQGAWQGDIKSLVDAEYIRDRIDAICGENVMSFGFRC